MTQRTDPRLHAKARLSRALSEAAARAGDRDDLHPVEAFEVVVALAVDWAIKLGMPEGAFLQVCVHVFRDARARHEHD